LEESHWRQFLGTARLAAGGSDDIRVVRGAQGAVGQGLDDAARIDLARGAMGQHARQPDAHRLQPGNPPLGPQILVRARSELRQG
jgi:hypothetical protein